MLLDEDLYLLLDVLFFVGIDVIHSQG